MRELRWFYCVLIFVLSGVFAHATPQLITGAGASFPYPLYAKWFAEYHQVDPSVEINYQSIGSGGGIRQFLAGTTDFGASDAPMSDKEIKQGSRSVLHVPMTLGAVAISYNVPGLKVPLRLNAEVLVDLFLGKIKNWDDERLQKLNPSLTLPKLPVIVCHRADGSGTTAVLTEYLAAVSPEWKSQVGIGKDVTFPKGQLGGKGNEGVTGLLRQNPGAVGYVEMNYAIRNRFAMAQLLNKDGQYVEPSVGSVTAAAESSLKNIPADFRVSIVNAPGKASYPISAFTYLLVSTEMEGQKGQKLTEFLKWAMGPGQTMSAGLHYAPLPPSIAKKVEQTIASIRFKKP